MRAFSAADFDAMMRMNVRGAWLTVRRFLPSLKETHGTLITVSSDVSTRVFDRGGLYCATKFALRAMIRAIQIENPDVSVIEFRPGAIDTHFAGNTPSDRTPTGRMSADDAAAALLTLLRLPPRLRPEELVKSRTQPIEY